MRLVPICGLLYFAALLQAQTSGDTQPAVLVRNDPEYSAEATRARVQSTVLLNIVIGEDGKAHNVQIAKGAGFGLDEKAIEAIATWIFRPATKDGHATPTPANIEMNFHLQVRGDADDYTGQFARLNFPLPPGASRPELIVGKLPGNPLAAGDQALRIHLQVDADGRPANVTLLGSTDKAWAQQALRVIQAWRFRPASLDGTAIPADGIFELAHSEPEEAEQSVNVPKAPPSPIQIPGLIPRSNHTATLLKNGTVLIAGGTISGTSAQIFDPITRTIVNTGNMLIARQSHTATLLNDGTVLIAGGETNGHAQAEAEIFDPSSGKFSATGSMREPRSGHAAALLADGHVLIFGGNKGPASSEIYDPRMKSFQPAGKMKYLGASVEAVTLRDGRVLILSAGNVPAEIFNPPTASFSEIASAQIEGAFSAVPLDNGTVFIASRGVAQIFEPATGVFRSLGAIPQYRRDPASQVAPASVLLRGGKLLLASLGQTEIYDPAAGIFTPGPSLASDGEGVTATLLEDGSVLIAGTGENDSGATAELLLIGSGGR